MIGLQAAHNTTHHEHRTCFATEHAIVAFHECDSSKAQVLHASEQTAMKDALLQTFKALRRVRSEHT